MREHEIERRPQCGDHHVDRLAGVLRTKEVLEEELVAFRLEAGQVHRLAIDLDAARQSRGQRLHQPSIEDGQARQGGTLVIQQHHPARLGHRRWGDTEEEQRQQDPSAAAESALHQIRLAVTNSPPRAVCAYGILMETAVFSESMTRTAASCQGGALAPRRPSVTVVRRSIQWNEDSDLLVHCASRPDWRISRTHLLRRPHGGRCNPLHSESRMRVLHPCSSVVCRCSSFFCRPDHHSSKSDLEAPGTGRVAGHVRDHSGTPLANVQVFVVGTALHALSDSLGAYLLPAVPEGRQEIRAAFIGYKASQATITVRAGKTTTHDFTLEQSAIQLNELTVTGASRDAVGARVEAGLGAPSSAAVSKQSYSERRMAEPWRRQGEPGNTEAYARIEDNRFLAAFANPVSTFSIDVDAASYSNVRRFLSEGALPPADAVRLEELVNYFPYSYPDRTGEHPFAVATDVGPCPWAPEHRLVRIGLQAQARSRRATCRRATWSF